MAKGYRPVERDQPYLLPPSMREWLPEDHPVWLVITVVEDHLDTSAFHALRKTGGAGAAGYDPDMLVAVLVWAYAHRVTSSRRIERLCQSDVAFRVICGGNLPDHVTFARFRAAFPGVVAGLFAEVLMLCGRLGMGRLGVVALDGMKIAASASKAANRAEGTLARLAAEMVARHGQDDAAEDALFGEGARGDEVAEDWSPRRRGQRIAAALADLAAGRQQAAAGEAAQEEAYWKRRAAGQPGGRAPAGAEVAVAEQKLARARAARAAQLAGLAARGAAPGAGIEDYCRVREAAAGLDAARARQAERAARAAAGPQPVRNITDPDSRLMPVRGGGFIQGYNTQNVTTEDKLILATELTQDPADCAWLEPMLERALAAAALLATCQPAAAAPPAPAARWPVGRLLADAGYCSAHNLTIPGPDRLIATGKHRDLEHAARGHAPASQARAGPAAAMAGRLKTAEGITAYRQRGHIAETPHGQIKHNMGFRQLSLRGKAKASAEWTFTTAVHNLFKAITTGHLTAQALTQLASPPR